MDVFATPLLNFNFQVSPTQYCAKSSEIAGWPGGVCCAATPNVRHKSVAREGRSFCGFMTKPRRTFKRIHSKLEMLPASKCDGEAPVSMSEFVRRHTQKSE